MKFCKKKMFSLQNELTLQLKNIPQSNCLKIKPGVSN